jgi:protein-tyrosine-phosphatase
MAEAWLKSELRRLKMDPFVEVSSCGVMSRDGGSVSTETILVLRNDEVELGNFQTRACRRDEVMEADLIFVMTDEHERYLRSFCPGLVASVINLQVDDPIGLTMEAYQSSYEAIKAGLKRHWSEVITDG